MSEFFQYEIEELTQILDTLRKFVITNNKNIRCTEYYIALDHKNFCQVLEDTFYDHNLDENVKKEHLNIMKTFLEKQKKLYNCICFENNPYSLDLKTKFEKISMIFGFSEDKNDLFSNLENTINRIDKKELVQ